MGSSSSKAARTASGAARRYPSRTPPTTAAPRTSNAPSQPPPPGDPSRPGPTVRPQARASETRNEAINLDASDPAYAASLRSLGAVNPHPHFSPSSTSPFDPSATSSTATSSPYASPLHQSSSHPTPINSALVMLAARDRLAQEAEREFDEVARRGRGAQGRQFLDVGLLRHVLMLRDEKGLSGEEIERRLGLRKGIVGRLGAKGVVESM
ncbi:hypothetical protein W97_01800 [Coniosporium apollinis CBS 100218]|uniref:Helix-turn-helix domain-containing protein n=1 Tax=Coniosporium apollinis (strain CBS 100218) TaxID=1168221 RepID=R7YLT4_CONA1|nr:uncharacterized protein W97_01800 [Coniosporium apollinis CBS 100218]EON62576.1 hypothetical protein W97_01800 [Coniosporium apollinis CBS 100218]